MFLVQQILNMLQNLARNDSMTGLQETYEIIDNNIVAGNLIGLSIHP